MTFSSATLGEYLFKLWLMPPEDELPTGDNVVPPIDRVGELLCDEPDISPERLRALLELSVGKAIEQHERVGLFLSGGLDSSTIAMLVKRSGKQMIAGTFRYGDAALEYEGISDDYKFTKLVCEREGIELLTVNAEVKDLESLSELVRFMDSPIADPAIIPSYLVAKRIAREADVVLSGHGGDELFGGYETYRIAIKEDTYGKLIPRAFFLLMQQFAEFMQSIRTDGSKTKFYRDLARFAQGAQYSFPFNHECFRSYFSVSEINRLVGSDAWLETYFEKIGRYVSFAERSISRLQVLQILDLYGTLQSHNLAYTVSACNAANIEVKFPIINEDIITYCLSIPDKRKMHGKQYKLILREAMRDILPKEILQRTPAGFAMPIRYWFSKNLGAAVDLLTTRNARIKSYLDADEIENILSSHVKGKSDNAMKIWALLTLELYLQHKRC